MITQFFIDFLGIALIAYITYRLLSDKEKQQIYNNAVEMK